MTSVERITEYSSVKGENLKYSKIKPDNKWPFEGKIVFDKVSFSYDDSLPNILKNLTLTINAKEKIGVVGRTGAGKSQWFFWGFFSFFFHFWHLIGTLFQALYRMAEPSGNILIDDVNIKDVSLHGLRSKISIIPVRQIYIFIF
jgi:ABC-type multidrug transport system fused ATPase/permease subunit